MTDQSGTIEQIVQDVVTAAPFEAYATQPQRTVAQAYAIQDGVVAALIGSGQRGAIAGWKIAANSPQLLERFKLDEPASGRVFADQKHAGPATLNAADYSEFAFEPEIAAIMQSTLDPTDAPFRRGDVVAAIERFVPAMELLDMRRTDMPNTHIPDAIAQNISNVGAVIGGPGIAPEDLDTAQIRTTLTIDGQVEHDVTGAAPQSPLDAVAWLATHLAARGLTLQAGQIVLCGTHSPIWYHEGTGEIEVEMSGLGKAAVTLI
ncbi:2-keto-4-pentenoate hydratase [Sedimentitalea todarodis]|uniref:Fumarylacetoacetate hydrolase family protein n=1 Tax=Sedimentitalea todarodis TaxID=1631240 RepID=A0ABU3VEB8_9RHOB|nr:fumarylacetoacetate hydrolase family protein [Sedimentitalea todarodis]MDU9004518.1 fumarylacetoacetate hydrolase family protein [Sedimentitalea todarodis]